jgi:hypothetical protein
MESIIVVVNDAAHARAVLEPMLASATPTHWVVVASAPRLTRRIGKWVTHSAREQWRARWAEQLFEQIVPMLRAAQGHRVETLLARAPLQQVTEQLQTRLGPATRILDARRPTVGGTLEPVTKGQSVDSASRLTPRLAAASGLCAILALAD